MKDNKEDNFKHFQHSTSVDDINEGKMEYANFEKVRPFSHVQEWQVLS